MAFQNPALLQGLPSFNEVKQNFSLAEQNPQTALALQKMNNVYFNQPVTTPEINQAISMPPKSESDVTHYQNFKNNFPYPTPSPRDFLMQNQIYEQKLAYDNAQRKYAKANTDEDKKIYGNLMEDAATNAKILRDNAQRLGLDITGFGADNTFSEAVQTLNYNRNRGMYELADMPSTTAQKNNIYNQMID